MADFREILPFGVGGFEAQSKHLPPDWHPWEYATAYHFLRLLKLLGVEQQGIAAQLDVTVSSVSMWVNQHRGTPAKYRPALRVYAGVMLEKAIGRLHKEMETLPPAERQALHAEFFTRVRRWGLEVQRDHGFLHETVQAECREVGTYAEKTVLSAEDRRALLYLCQSLQRQLHTLEELDTVPEEASSEQDGPQTQQRPSRS